MFALYPKDFDSSFDFCGSLFKSSSSDWNSQIAVWKNHNVKSFCAHKNSLRWKKSKLKFKTIQYFVFVFLTCCAFHFPFHAIWNHTFPQSVLLQHYLYQKFKNYISMHHACYEIYLVLTRLKPLWLHCLFHGYEIVL